MTGDFAIIAEGITDQIVLKNVILGFFDEQEEPVVNFEQPLLDATSQSTEYAHGGWTLVRQYFQERKFLQALQLNKYLVVHVDADIASDLGIARVVDGKQRTPAEFVGAIIEYFRRLIRGLRQASGCRGGSEAQSRLPAIRGAARHRRCERVQSFLILALGGIELLVEVELPPVLAETLLARLSQLLKRHGERGLVRIHQGPADGEVDGGLALHDPGLTLQRPVECGGIIGCVCAALYPEGPRPVYGLKTLEPPAKDGSKKYRPSALCTKVSRCKHAYSRRDARSRPWHTHC